MAIETRAALCNIIKNFGHDIVADKKKLKGLLNDFCGDSKRAINLILSAHQEKIPIDLASSQINGCPELTFDRFAKKLVDMGFSEDDSRWCVETWALALEKITEKQCKYTSLPVSIASSPNKNNSSESKIRPASVCLDRPPSDRLPKDRLSSDEAPHLTQSSVFNGLYKSFKLLIASTLIGLILGLYIHSHYERPYNSKESEIANQIIAKNEELQRVKSLYYQEKNALLKQKSLFDQRTLEMGATGRNLLSLEEQKGTVIERKAILDSDCMPMQDKLNSLISATKQHEFQLTAIAEKQKQLSEKKDFLQADCLRLQQSIRRYEDVRLSEDQIRQRQIAEEIENAAKQKAEAEKAAAQKAAAERAAKQKADAERAASQKASAERVAKQKADADRAAAQKAAAEKARRVNQAAPPQQTGVNKPAPRQPNMDDLWNAAGEASKQIHKLKGF